MCSGLRGRTYPEKLSELDLDTLVTRRSKCDMIQVWKIVHNYDNIDESCLFERLHVDAQRLTRATNSDYNLRQKQSNLDLRRNFFSQRVINEWNTLPENVKSCDKLLTFKEKLKIVYRQ